MAAAVASTSTTSTGVHRFIATSTGVHRFIAISTGVHRSLASPAVLPHPPPTLLSPDSLMAKATQSYVGLARKWRPKIFDDVVGQPYAVDSLRLDVSTGRVKHAYLFSGPRGVGKTSMARILAKAMNCDKGPTPAPCGVCDRCRAITEGFDVDTVEIDAATYTKVENIRDLQEGFNRSPLGGKWKVYIIDEVHMLSDSAFNALLKSLEEPPSRVIFVLATTNPEKIPETVQSRCSRIEFRRIAPEDIARQLGMILDSETAVKVRAEERDVILESIAMASEGGMRDAEVALDQLISLGESEITLERVQQLLGVVESSMLREAVVAMRDRDTSKLLSLVGSLVDRGRDIQRFVKALLHYLRDLLVLRVAGNREESDVYGVMKSRAGYGEMVQLAHQVTTPFLINAINQFLSLDERLRGIAPARFLLEFTFIKLAEVDRAIDLEAALTALSKGRPGGPGPGPGPGQGGPGGGAGGRGGGPANPVHPVIPSYSSAPPNPVHPVIPSHSSAPPGYGPANPVHPVIPSHSSAPPGRNRWGTTATSASAASGTGVAGSAERGPSGNSDAMPTDPETPVDAVDLREESPAATRATASPAAAIAPAPPPAPSRAPIPAPAPVAATAPAAPATPEYASLGIQPIGTEDAGYYWKVLLHELRGRFIQIATSLDSAGLLEIKEGQIRIGFPSGPGNDVPLKILQRPDKRRDLEAVASAVAGRSLRIQIESVSPELLNGARTQAVAASAGSASPGASPNAAASASSPSAHAPAPPSGPPHPANAPATGSASGPGSPGPAPLAPYAASPAAPQSFPSFPSSPQTPSFTADPEESDLDSEAANALNARSRRGVDLAAGLAASGATDPTPPAEDIPIWARDAGLSADTLHMVSFQEAMRRYPDLRDAVALVQKAFKATPQNFNGRPIL